MADDIEQWLSRLGMDSYAQTLLDELTSAAAPS